MSSYLEKQEARKRAMAEAGIKKASMPTNSNGFSQLMTEGLGIEINNLASGGKYQELDINLLVPSPKDINPYEIYEGERKDNLLHSIETTGIHEPLLVLKKDNKYQIMSGHNRYDCAKKLNFEKVPCIIYENLSDDEIKIIINDTNLIARGWDTMTYYERANAIKLRQEAYKVLRNKKGLKDDSEENKKEQNENKKGRIREKLSQEFGLSGGYTIKYMRIADKLEKPLFTLLDNGKLSLQASYDVSFLNKNLQNSVIKALSDESLNLKLDDSKAKYLHKTYGEDKIVKEDSDISLDNFYLDLIKKEKKDSDNIKFKFKKDTFTKYFKEDDKEDYINDILEKALSQYFANNN